MVMGTYIELLYHLLTHPQMQTMLSTQNHIHHIHQGELNIKHVARVLGIEDPQIHPPSLH